MLPRMEKREVWSARVREWQASGQGLADFCRGKGFTPGGLRYWVNRLGASTESSRDRPAGGPKTVRIARVVRTRSKQTSASVGRMAPRPVWASDPSPGQHVVVEVGPMRVLVPVGLGPAQFEGVLVAIGRASKGGAE
jgi:hypothetical protein